MKGFGKILIDLRGDNTQEKVAKDLGIATSTLGMYETEKEFLEILLNCELQNITKSLSSIFFLIRNVTK